MGTTGCVSYLFETRGVMLVEKKPEHDDDEMMMLALDCGADDFNLEDGMYEILTSPADFSVVREKLESQGVSFVKSEVAKIPANYISVDDATLPKIQRMLDMFDDNDDVQNVYHNAELPEDEDEE